MSEHEIPTQLLLSLMDEELQLTVGCTDPTAMGLGVAAAVETYIQHVPAWEKEPLVSQLSSLEVTVDRNLFKNASSVGLPQMGESGIPLAIALGALIHDTARSLLLFEYISPDLKLAAHELVKTVPIAVLVDETSREVSVLVSARWKDGCISGASIKGHHNRILWTSFNDKKTMSQVVAEKIEDNAFPQMGSPIVLEDLEALARAVEKIPDSELGKLAQGIAVNREASNEGLSDMYGFSEGPSPVRLVYEARRRVENATRARMGGKNIPIMATGGSGNHGITVFLTLYEGWQLSAINPDHSLLQGALLAVVVLYLIKQKTGILTPMCGCAVSSALAVSCSLVWGLGGTAEQMLQAMNIVLNSLGGVVCDGAKVSCSLKTSLGAQVALESALSAMKGMVVPPSEGLASDSFSGLLETLRRIHVEGMASFDQTMVSIIRARNANKKIEGKSE
ncbi:L-serine ammonia-lyase, iron-sulfur-dependent, subunit alpha [uncultured Sphaerochaeta sp.]|uniref:L-serine ammonia-lyase, iron-sulfur-dependent, subunit alpha n=1 Tax=uncultured Sphaerochaeta sp. TaxID=886478 RepID=UPI002A0A399F|nr:L-serine ammonia-lyase, iron-sulfur-dependent, subunit alpha [uncultured Sphaerochaeta sp.]